jgi:hypothetical protein
MQLKTILNRVTCYKSFVFAKATWVENSQAPAMEIEGSSATIWGADLLGLRSGVPWLRHDARAAAI